MNEIIATVLQTIIAAAVPIITGFLVRLLTAKAREAAELTQSDTARRYVSEAADAVTAAVAFVSQTYVDELKASKTFSRENQKSALDRAAHMAGVLLTDGAKTFIEQAYGSLRAYLVTQIEAEVNTRKGVC